MVLSFEQAGDLLDTLAESFPEALFDGLNGGVNLQEEAVPDQEFPKGQVYILGEYCDDLLGRYINLYYGSFAALLEEEDEEVWKDEIFATVAHEFTHHLEEDAGLHNLDDKDLEFLQEALAEYEDE